MKMITNKTFDEERALYGEKDLVVKNCNFDGSADGVLLILYFIFLFITNTYITYLLITIRHSFSFL